MQVSTLSVPPAPGHNRAGRAGDVSSPDRKKKNPATHLIIVIKDTGRDTLVEILLSSQRAAFDHVLSKRKSWHENDHFKSLSASLCHFRLSVSLAGICG